MKGYIIEIIYKNEDGTNTDKRLSKNANAYIETMAFDCGVGWTEFYVNSSLKEIPSKTVLYFENKSNASLFMDKYNKIRERGVDYPVNMSEIEDMPLHSLDIATKNLDEIVQNQNRFNILRI